MSEFYNPGDIIYSGKPFTQSVLYALREKCCDYCFQFIPPIFSRMRHCCRCRHVHYCGKQCQRASWSRHKLECPLLCNIKEEGYNYVREIGQNILLLKGKDWKSISEPVGNTNRSFYDLVSHAELTKNDPELSLHGLQVLRLVKEYLGEANVCTDDEILEIFGKIHHNSFGVRSGRGSALYIGASIFDHACIPNAIRSFEGNTMIVRAITRIPKDDIRKVTISYCEMLFTDAFSNTKKVFYGPCKCDDCSLPYGDSKLTKIFDKTRAWSIIESTKCTLTLLMDLIKYGGSLAPERMDSVKDLLNKQRGVLGDTNLLRMKLLIFKAAFETNTTEKIEDLKKAAAFAEKAFGENNIQILEIYDKLGSLSHGEADIYIDKGRRLRALLDWNE